MKATDMGMNRTGVGTSPREAKKTIEGALQGEPSSDGDEDTAKPLRQAYIKSAPPIGKMPPPTTLRGLAKSALKALKAEKSTVLLDKLGERLAFERTGTRLYEALITKAEALPRGPVPLDDLYEHRDEELMHFDLVRRAILELGGDPTVMTPCADMIGVASLGLLQVVSDPRTDLAMCMNAMLTAEATDNEGWPLLIELCEGFDLPDLAAEFRMALRNEEKHLMRVRAWLTMLVADDAGVELAAMLPDGGETELDANELIVIGQELVEEGASRLHEE